MTYNPREWLRENIPDAEIPLFRDWLLDQGGNPANVAWDQWIERRDTAGERRIVWLEPATRDGEPVMVERSVSLLNSPTPFPTP